MCCVHVNAHTHFTEKEEIQLLWCWVNRANEIRNEQSAEDVIEMNVLSILWFFRSFCCMHGEWQRRSVLILAVVVVRSRYSQNRRLLFRFIPHAAPNKYVCLYKWCHSNCVQSFESNQIQLNIELKWDEMELNVTTVLFECTHTPARYVERTRIACMWKRAIQAFIMKSMMKFIWERETRDDPN